MRRSKAVACGARSCSKALPTDDAQGEPPSHAWRFAATACLAADAVATADGPRRAAHRLLHKPLSVMMLRRCLRQLQRPGALDSANGEIGLDVGDVRQDQ